MRQIFLSGVLCAVLTSGLLIGSAHSPALVVTHDKSDYTIDNRGFGSFHHVTQPPNQLPWKEKDVVTDSLPPGYATSNPEQSLLCFEEDAYSENISIGRLILSIPAGYYDFVVYVLSSVLVVVYFCYNKRKKSKITIKKHRRRKKRKRNSLTY